MCGIAGFVPRAGQSLAPGAVQRMLHSLAHRGPDDRGVLAFAGGEVRTGRDWPGGREGEGTVLIHRRLSILDLAETGWQPMGTPDGRYFIVFNGEIYNYVELRAELLELGHRFRSTSDTEVLLAAFAEWGAEMLPRLVGMFAFAILDTLEHTLFLARDFFGIKPLYCATTGHGFVFASEIKTLLELPGVPRQINPHRLYDYLRYSITDHGDETLLEGVSQLAAAHYVRVDLRTATAGTPVRYWKVDLDRRAEMSFEQAAEEVRERFLQNVRLHLRSDVPVGAALSGGIDSSAIAMCMRHLEPGLELHTFSYVADDPAVSEERWADIVVAASGAHAHKVGPTPEDLVAELDRLIWVQDEPFFSTSMYAQNRVFRAASEAGVKVMLDGQGADEILGGYRMYTAARLVSLVRQRKLGGALELLRNASRMPGRSGVWRQAGQFLIPPSVQGPFRRMVGESLVPDWMNGEWFAARGVAGRALRSSRRKNALHEQLLHTVEESSLPALLRFEDRNSMAYSVESRVPFLTADFVQFILSLPEEYLISPEGTTKAVIRRAMRGIVPDAILDRRDKVGFATPEQRWLSTLAPWVDRVLQSEAARAIPALNHAAVLSQWAEIREGRRPFDFRVWRWLNLVRWSERFEVGMR